MPEPVIVASARTPIGRARKGSLATMRASELVSQVLDGTFAQVPSFDPHTLDDIHLGCGQPAGEQGHNLARLIAVARGWDTVSGVTVQRYCSSSLQTTRMAAHAIRAGEGAAFLSVGVETVSRYDLGKSDGLPNTTDPIFESARRRTHERSQGGAAPWSDPRERGDTPDIYVSMGQTAENVAQRFGVTRDQQDEFAARSQQRAERAIADGFWRDDITPVTLPDGRVIASDDSPRAGTTIGKLATLEPVFRPDGSVTAGNACPLNDGAAAVLVLSEEAAERAGLTPIARIVATGVSALSPEIMGMGPVEATRRALAHAGLTIDDIDVIELNEAFAAQAVPVIDQLGADPERVNPFGGAIAIGHPFGMTGARLTHTLLHGLQVRGGRYGLETMCVAGGQGMAMIVERLT